MEGRHLQLLYRALDLVEDGDLLERLCSALPELLGVSGAAVAVLGPSASGGIVTSSDPTSDALVALHLELGEGPAVDAVRRQVDVRVQDLAADAVRWPAFVAAASELQVGALFASPAQLGGILVGVLLLHRRTPAPLSPAERVLTATAAELCTALLLDRRAGMLHTDVASPRLADWPDRAIVHQATGMVAVQIDGDLAGALARLRAYAFAHAIPLDAVAHRVVDRQLTFEP